MERSILGVSKQNGIKDFYLQNLSYDNLQGSLYLCGDPANSIDPDETAPKEESYQSHFIAVSAVGSGSQQVRFPGQAHSLGSTVAWWLMPRTPDPEESAVAWWLMPRTLDPEVGVRAPLGSNRVVSLSKAYLLPKSTGNTQEAAALSQHD